MYVVTAIFYNLFLHPLRQVPGPFLAKIRYPLNSTLITVRDAAKADMPSGFSSLWQLYTTLAKTGPFAVQAAHDRYGKAVPT